MNKTELARIAQAMVAPGRGILAADESSNTIKRRFDAIGVASTPDTRRDYRELLFRTSDAMSKYVSGVIAVRRDHPPEGEGRHGHGRNHRGGARDPRHQGG